MRRPVGPLLLLSLLWFGCPPPEEGFDFTLRLNLAGDTTLLDDLDTIEIDLFYTDGSQHQESWDWFALDSELSIEEVPRGENVFFRVRGMADTGSGLEEIAVGESDPVQLPGTDEVWVLFHRHGALLELEYGGDVPRMGHEVLAVEGGAVVVGGEMGGGEYAPISKLVRTERQGFALEDVSNGPPRAGFSSAVFPAGPRAGQVLIAGGNATLENFENIQDTYGVWDPADEEYSEVNLALQTGRHRGRAVPLTDPSGAGHIVLMGGVSEKTNQGFSLTLLLETVHSAANDTESVNLGDVRWELAPVTWGPTETVISCGSFDHIVNEGYFEAGTGCDEYYVASQTHTLHDDVLQQPRAAHGAVTVQINEDEKILLVGGTPDDEPDLRILDGVQSALANAELVDPAHQYATQLIDMIHARAHPLVLRLPDERKVLVCGGHDGVGLRSDCEIFDELSQTFSLAQDISLPTPANDVRGAVLEDGSALIVGGNVGDYEPGSFALIYLP